MGKIMLKIRKILIGIFLVKKPTSLFPCNQFIDLACYGEGEKPFASILDSAKINVTKLTALR